jgi:peroxiredoxin
MWHLQELYTKYQDKGLVILGFNPSDDKKIALEFLAENKATFPCILDSSEKATKVSFQDYHGSGVPLNYIIDREGKIVDGWYGYEKGHPRVREALKKTGGELAEAIGQEDSEENAEPPAK